MEISQLAAVGIDAADPRRLGAFYEKLTGWKVTRASDHFVALDGGQIWLTIHQIDHHQRPTWPSSQVPKQMHLDFEVNDLDAAQSEAVEAGAVLADTQPRPEAWRVLIDPEGHPFCLCLPIST
jgi:predicted enzyme related to lactoylglutathione lyase